MAVANYLIESGNTLGISIDLLKVNKLTYVSYGFFYGFLKRCLYEDRIEAWQYGPVIPELYHTFKSNGKQSISSDKLGRQFDWMEGKDYIPRVAENKRDVLDVLDHLLDLYKDTKSADLIDRTHVKGSPWACVYRPNVKNIEIPKKYIEIYYGEILKDAAPKV